MNAKVGLLAGLNRGLECRKGRRDMHTREQAAIATGGASDLDGAIRMAPK